MGPSHSYKQLSPSAEVGWESPSPSDKMTTRSIDGLAGCFMTSHPGSLRLGVPDQSILDRTALTSALILSKGWEAEAPWTRWETQGLWFVAALAAPMAAQEAASPAAKLSDMRLW